MTRVLMCLQEGPIQLSDGRNVRHDRREKPEATPMN